MSEATARPWHVSQERADLVADERGLFVADCRMMDEGKANAALIVAAVNSYSPSQAALLKEAREALEETETFWRHNGSHQFVRKMAALIARLRSQEGGGG